MHLVEIVKYSGFQQSFGSSEVENVLLCTSLAKSKWKRESRSICRNSRIRNEGVEMCNEKNEIARKGNENALRLNENSEIVFSSSS